MEGSFINQGTETSKIQKGRVQENLQGMVDLI